jgi:hypothetical protein
MLIEWILFSQLLFDTFISPILFGSATEERNIIVSAIAYYGIFWRIFIKIRWRCTHYQLPVVFLLCLLIIIL